MYIKMARLYFTIYKYYMNFIIFLWYYIDYIKYINTLVNYVINNKKNNI